MIEERQIRAARALIGWSQAELAAAAGLSLPTIKRMESLGPGRSSVNNVAAVRRALELAGIVFVPSNGGGPGVRLRDAGEDR